MESGIILTGKVWLLRQNRVIALTIINILDGKSLYIARIYDINTVIFTVLIPLFESVFTYGVSGFVILWNT